MEFVFLTPAPLWVDQTLVSPLHNRWKSTCEACVNDPRPPPAFSSMALGFWRGSNVEKKKHRSICVDDVEAISKIFARSEAHHPKPNKINE